MHRHEAGQPRVFGPADPTPRRGRRGPRIAMSSTGDVLAAFVASLAAQVAPEPVVLDDGSLDHTQLTGTVVRPLTLDRVGRSRRDGAILDLELTVEVTTLG